MVNSGTGADDVGESGAKVQSPDASSSTSRVSAYCPRTWDSGVGFQCCRSTRAAQFPRPSRRNKDRWATTTSDVHRKPGVSFISLVDHGALSILYTTLYTLHAVIVKG